MRGVNKVIVVGSCGRDPEIRYAQGGSAIANVSVATSESWKDKATGEQKTETTWHRIVAFNRLAEIFGEFVRKGTKIYVEGSLRTRQYEKDGQTHYSTEIVAREMQMLGGRSDSENAGTDSAEKARPASRAQTPGQRARQQQSAPVEDFNDEIPF